MISLDIYYKHIRSLEMVVCRIMYIGRNIGSIKCNSEDFRAVMSLLDGPGVNWHEEEI